MHADTEPGEIVELWSGAQILRPLAAAAGLELA